MKRCSICGVVKSKTYSCKDCGNIVCLSCFDFTHWLCSWCREKVHEEEYTMKEKYKNPKVTGIIIILAIILLFTPIYSYAEGFTENNWNWVYEGTVSKSGYRGTGVKILTKQPLILKNVTIDSHCTANYCNITTILNVSVGDGNITGSICRLNSPATLTNNTYYYFLVHNADGGSYSTAYGTGDGQTTNNTYGDFVRGYVTGAETASQMNDVYRFGGDLPNADVISFANISKVPQDINSLNLFSYSDNLVLSYNITSVITGIINSSVGLWHKANNSVNEQFVFLNGSSTLSGWLLENNFTNTTSNYTFSIDETFIYPATYNILQEEIESLAHSGIAIGASDIVRINIINVTNNTRGFFEVMLNSTTGAGLSSVYYCNSSYSSGNPSVNSNCIVFGTLTAMTGFNHTHSANSKHQILPFILSNGKIGNVGITSNSSFLIDSSGAGTWSVWSVSNNVREGAYQLSANSGLTYTAQTGTIDAHLHQYPEEETFYYMATACNSAVCQNSTLTDDRIDFVDLPPTSPIVIRPNSTDVFNTQVNITFINGTATPPNTLLNSSADLLNESLDFVVNIMKNTTNTTKIFNSGSIASGNYYIRVQNCDNESLCSYGYSSLFAIDNTNPSITGITPTNGSSVFNNGSVTITATLQDSRDLYDVFLNITNTTGETFYSATDLISGTSYAYAKTFSTTTAINESTYLGYIRVCDSHTGTSIKPADTIDKNSDEIIYHFGDTEISITSQDGETIESISSKFDDRYSFGFKYLTPKFNTKKYLLTSNKPLDYIERSKYKGHFVVDKYWVDFEGQGEVKVSEVLTNVFEVSIISGKEEIIFDSIGELNCFTEEFNFIITGIALDTGLYSNNWLSGTNWFNQDAMDLSTTAGVLIIFFLLFVWICLVALTEVSRIPIIGVLTSVYGFFLGYLFFTLLSAIMGVVFIIINLIYILRSVMLSQR